MQSPEVLGWAEAQTAITESILRDDPRWIHLRQRLNTLAKFNKVTPPIMAAGKLFFFENDGTTSQPKIVMLDESTGEARIVLDVNTLSTDGTVAVPIFKPSPDGALMAYAIADGGSDWNVVRVLNVATGENLPDVLERTRYTPIGWLEDGSAFYYARYPEKSGSDMQFSQVWLHRIGTPQSDDTLIFETPDRPELNHVPLLTDDRKYIVLNTWKDLNGSRIWVLPLDRPGEVVKLIDDDSQASAFSGNIGTRFYIVTQHGAPRGRVVYIDLDAPGEMHEVIPEGDGVVSGYFGGAALCNGHLVVLSLKDVTSRIDYYTLDGQHARSVDLPTLGTIGMHSFGEADRADFYIRFRVVRLPADRVPHRRAGWRRESLPPAQVGFRPVVHSGRSGFLSEQGRHEHSDVHRSSRRRAAGWTRAGLHDGLRRVCRAGHAVVRGAGRAVDGVARTRRRGGRSQPARRRRIRRGVAQGRYARQEAGGVRRSARGRRMA
ncbi:MAG: hypothetical protein HND48_17490 [Chloroflexi bacterium]|nr:hypothetical protein [Chloroflexota bacterium]